MKAFSKFNKRSILFVAALCCLMLAGSISAFAVNPKQVAFVPNAQTFEGKCCLLWNETVSITETSSVVPVIVTWSADLVVNAANGLNDDVLVGLSVNGGPCTAYGSRVVPMFWIRANSQVVNATHQWVVFPNAGLTKGTNTFALCGGGDNEIGDTITFGESILTVLK